jgi:hypothetical protein
VPGEAVECSETPGSHQEVMLRLLDWREMRGECCVRPEQHVAYTYVPDANDVLSPPGLDADVALRGWAVPISICS